jgi:hypothetical protein
MGSSKIIKGLLGGALIYTLFFVVILKSFPQINVENKHTHISQISKNIELDHSWGSVIDPYYIGMRNMKFTQMDESFLNTRQVKDPIRVCFCVREFAGIVKNGGIATAYYELGKYLASTGMNVSVLLLTEINFSSEGKSFESWQATFKNEGITLIRLPKTNILVEPWVAAENYKTQRWLLEHEKDFDIVHFADNTGSGYHTLLAKKQGWAFQNITFITTLHGTDLWAKLLSKRYPSQKFEVEMAFYEQQTVELADYVVAPSLYIHNYVEARGWSI